ncbi:hypothetical protein ACSZMV_20580, partial [Aeromonas veronii]
QGFPELLTDDFSCHAAYVGVGIIRINSVLLAALNPSPRSTFRIGLEPSCLVPSIFLSEVIPSAISKPH